MSQLKTLVKRLVDIGLDQIWNFSFFPVVDVAKALVDGFDTETMVTDITQAKEAMLGMEFEIYNENHGNQVLKGIPLDKFEIVMRTIAASNKLPDTFVNEVLLGIHIDAYESDKNEFVFNVGEKSNVWYWVVTTKKVGSDKIDIALAFYNLKFKMADRELHHSEDQTFLGFRLWTKEWTTSEPRKLNSNDQNLFVNFLRAKAITGFIKDHHYIASDATNHQHTEEL